MIDNPEIYADKFIDNGADILTFHYEAEERELDLQAWCNVIEKRL